MKQHVARLSILSFIILSLGPSSAQAPPIPAEEQPAGAETLTRGPVHEAFAEPVTLQAEAGLVAPKAPPANIVEYPPPERPEGDGYVWVPGYWSWDSDRNDHVWVSACWRVAPPNMRWVPGYWTQVTDGWEWVAGFWNPAESEAIEYLPTPPEPVELQPPGPAPDPASVWVPGCWYWAQGRPILRHGYWLTEQAGWVWVPSHYRWSPRGYVFVEGHWDYPLADRGVLFAPVYFPPSVYAQVGFAYSPSIVIDLGLLTGNLFASPRYCHYYFGDYYDDAYLRTGIYPQFESERIRTWYDPLYQYERWSHRIEEPRWGEHQREIYDRRRADKDLRPPRTYREMQDRVERVSEQQRRSIEFAGSLRTVVARQANPPRLERITNETRQQLSEQGRKVHQYRDQRVKWESPTSARASVPTRDEQKGVVVPPREQPRDQQRPKEQQPPREQKPSVAQTREAASPGGGTAHPAPWAPPREVHLTEPERVKVPSSPVVGKFAAQPDKTRSAVPPAPGGEHKDQGKEQKKNTPSPKGAQKDKQDR